MHNIQELGQQLKQALDQIGQVASDPNQLQRAVANAKALVDQLVQQTQQSRDDQNRQVSQPQGQSQTAQGQPNPNQRSPR